jgi:16S rRNA (guanine966-N2)-methyltransferase
VEALAGTAAPEAAYDLVFADPPYALTADELRSVLADLLANGWVAPGALVVVERSSRDEAWVWPAGISPDRERRYGEATLWYGRAAGPPE